LLAFFRSIKDRKLQDILVFARGLDDAPHMIGREYGSHRDIERLGGGLLQADGDIVALALGLAVEGIDQRLIDVVLRFEDELLRRAVFPSGRAQVAERNLALPVTQSRDLTEWQGVSAAGMAGEVVEDSPTRAPRGGIAARVRQLELIDRPMGGELACWRQRRHALRGKTADHSRRRQQSG